MQRIRQFGNDARFFRHREDIAYWLRLTAAQTVKRQLAVLERGEPATSVVKAKTRRTQPSSCCQAACSVITKSKASCMVVKAPNGWFRAAAALTEMAGWMAHDSGRDRAAEQHFARSLDLVKLGCDRQLGVHILASMSHLAHHQGKPADAIQYARRGREALARGPRLPELEARLLAMQARGFAALRRSEDCTQLLIEAERVLGAQTAEERSPWVSHFDAGSLANEAARCLRQLGDLTQAECQAKRVIELRPVDRTRSRAFGQLILVTVLIAQGGPDEACAIAQEVLDATQQLSSYLVIQQLLDLRPLLEPHRGTRVVAEFLSCLDEALRERVWLYQWLIQDGLGDGTALGESW